MKTPELPYKHYIEIINVRTVTYFCWNVVNIQRGRKFKWHECFDMTNVFSQSQMFAATAVVVPAATAAAAEYSKIVGKSGMHIWH